MTLGVEDPAWQPIASRIALNARDAGLVLVSGRVMRPPMCGWWRRGSLPPNRRARWPAIAAALGLPDPPALILPKPLCRGTGLLDGYRVIPLFHLPDVYGVGPRVKGGPGITPLGEWRFENLWLEGARP